MPFYVTQSGVMFTPNFMKFRAEGKNCQNIWTGGWTDIKHHKRVSFKHIMQTMAAGRSIPRQLSKCELQAVFLYVRTSFFRQSSVVTSCRLAKIAEHISVMNYVLIRCQICLRAEEKDSRPCLQINRLITDINLNGKTSS